MEIFYQPIQIGIGLLITGGLGLGLIRLGKLLQETRFLSRGIEKLERSFHDFKRDNDTAHIDIRAGIADTRERIMGVETKVKNLPCNGRGFPPACPEPGGEP